MNTIKKSLLLKLVLFSLIFCTQVPTPSAFAQITGSLLPSKGKAFNPDISINVLGLWQRATAISDDRTQVPHNGLSLQEAEIQFTSDVDPYLRGSALLSIRQESGSSGFIIDPEEVFLNTLSLPMVTLRAGKFKMAMGKHNQIHTHAFPFLDWPLIHQLLMGDEGLNETGASAAALIPAPWYSEIIIQAFTLSNDEIFASTNSGKVGGLARFKNLFDLSDDLTMEFGLSGATGNNQFDRTATILGSDLTFKWRPSVGGKYKALIWQTEYLNGNRPGLSDSITGESLEKLGGIATWLQYQFAERWWVQARYEFIGLPHSVAILTQNKQSALIGFFPSEFSGLRLQYDHLTTQGKGKADHSIAFQYNISIGAHPAHMY